MKNKVCILLMFVLLLMSISPTYAYTLSAPQVVLPQGEKLDDTEMAEIHGEVAPWVVGAAIGGATDAALKVIDNIASGKEGTEILDGCAKEFLTGAVSGAITAPVKIVTETIGIFTTAKKVYDTSKTAISVGAGVASYVTGKVYDKVKESNPVPEFENAK